ncbi:MAG: hypothetical protein MSC31_18755 [Solirubrobacteraceae bacterium MAG38_C4-C5]|nr:hypothetical protein [Candidatus Siliceabacter maunaloa]
MWTPSDTQRVVAYHSIAPTVVRRDELPSRGMAGGYSTVVVEAAEAMIGRRRAPERHAG